MSIYIIHEKNRVGELAGIVYVTQQLERAIKVFDEIMALKDEAMRKEIAAGYGKYLPDDPFFQTFEEEEDLIRKNEYSKQGEKIIRHAQSYDWDLKLEEFGADTIYLSSIDKGWLEDE